VELFVDSNDSRALAVQLYEQLRDAITEGRLASGERLAPTRSVAADLRLSRSTVTEAYGRLTAEGYVEGRSGGGTVVSSVPLRPVRSRTTSAALAPTKRAAGLAPYGAPTATAAFDLRPGSLDSALFPVLMWRRCMQRALAAPPGHYGEPAGSPELRTALANWVARSRGVSATPDELVVTSGAGHAVDLVARVLADPGAVVAVEEPGYPPVIEVLRSQGMRVIGVPVDGEGVVVDALPSQARLVYVTPSHQYPLGMVMSRRRRLELLQWAGRAGAAIVEDDYDSEFRHTARPLEPLQRLDKAGRVIYVGTFSKSLSPALRMGFLVAPRSLLPAICAVRQAIDWCPPYAPQLALAALISEGHLDRHLRRCRAAYRERQRLMWAALGRLLPPGHRRLPAEAGLHLTVRSPTAAADDRVWSAIQKRDLLVGSLGRTYQFSDPAAGFLLGFGAVPTQLVTTAVRAFCSALGQAAGGHLHHSGPTIGQPRTSQAPT